MDPETTWGDFLLAKSENRYDEAAEAAHYLCNWISQGGFIPKEIGYSEHYLLRAYAECYRP